MESEERKIADDTLIDTGCIVARYQPAASNDLLVISFAHITRWKAIWGGPFFRKNGISVIGITDYRKAWYQKKHMDRVMPEIIPILAKYKRVVTYGHSMGAYGAMKYGRSLNAELALAFSPQHSIDPHDVARFDVERTKHFRADAHKCMKVKEEDLPSKTIVFVDWKLAVDREHAKRLPKTESLSFVHCPFARHQTVEMLTKARLTSRLFKMIRAGQQSAWWMRFLVLQALLKSHVFRFKLG